MEQKKSNDFSQGSVAKNILSIALPMTLAQLINVLYSVIDRMYIGRIPEAPPLWRSRASASHCPLFQ